MTNEELKRQCLRAAANELYDAAEADGELSLREMMAQKAAAARMYRMAERVGEPIGTETTVRRPVLR